MLKYNKVNIPLSAKYVFFDFISHIKANLKNLVHLFGNDQIIF